VPDSPSLVPFDALPPGGSIRPITRWGTEVMHKPAQKVAAFDDRLRQLVGDLSATMYAADGVGLAACQVGVDLAVFVFDCPDASGRYVQGVVCNPELTVQEGSSRRLEDSEEGCLSYPGAFVNLARPDHASVRGVGLLGQAVQFSGDGLLARCLQHETDHTRGIVFGDRLATKLSKKLRKEHLRNAADYPSHWPADA
jgi:peptide deformylase